MKRKLLLYTSILILIMLIFRCSEDFLDQKPTSVVIENNYFKTLAELEKGLIACYASVSSGGPLEFELWDTGNVGSDDSDCGSVPTDQPDGYDLSYSRQKSTNAWIEWYWRDFYSVIGRCNFLIEKAKNVPGDSKTIERITDQARFLRAMAYYHLVSVFGDIPMPLEFLTPDKLNIKRSSSEEVWTQIERDLVEAADLPVASEWNSKGRVSSGAVNSLLGKVYLTRKKYSQANSAFNKVLMSGEYELVPDFGFIFRREGENCRESIFEFQYKVNIQGEQSMGNWSAIWRLPSDLAGFGFDCPTQDLLDEFETGDPRIIYTFIFKGDEFALPDGTAYTIENPNSPTGYQNRKAWIPFNEVIGAFDWEKNFRYMRYSEVLLLYAESLNEVNKSDSALILLNMVRERARNTPPVDPERISCAFTLSNTGELLPDVTTKEQNALRNAIWHEQRVEIAMECQRRFYLLRTGRFKERMETAKEYGKCIVEPHELLLPIPEIDRQISNYTLTQNPGY